ncbi:hypothetical protein C8F01DRAFT_1156526 [Mycena amicta]|nr:hypothetical protein C8F01DRAFT_1156526 [Mycena amicta]
MYTDILELVREIRFSPYSPRLSVDEIHSLRVELAATETSIRDLHLQLARLEARREDIQKKLATIVYPVSSLPAEILCRIFAAAVSSSPLDEVHATLLKITAVCQQWRATAIGDPNLWTTIQYTGVDDLFECFLARTRGLPLHLSTEQDVVGDISESETLMASSSQWKQAKLLAPEVMAPFSRIKRPLDLPWLEKLTLHAYPSPALSKMFSQATRLRELSVSYASLVLQLGFPTRQIRKLVVSYPTSVADILSMLALMPELEDLTLYFVSDHEDVTEPLLMSALSTLSLFNKHSAEELLGHLLLPALGTLHLNELSEEDTECIVDCISRSSANVRSISLHFTEYDSATALLGSPKIASTVRELVFEPYNMPSQEEKSFASDLGNGEFLPGLESFTLLIPRTSPSPIRIRPFVDGVTERVWNALFQDRWEELKLKEFTLDFASREISREDVEDLRFLDGHVQVKMPQGFPAMKPWESKDVLRFLNGHVRVKMPQGFPAMKPWESEELEDDN